VSYTSKNWCVLLLRGEICGKEDESAQFVLVTFAQFSGEKEENVTKISRTLVRGGFAVVVSLSFSDLWVCFGGGFQTKKMVLRLLI
jgi:hypothetical protein